MASTLINGDDGMTAVLQECATALHSVAAYRLPSGLDRRLLWLSEHKEELAPSEREELEALVDLAQQRTAEKLQAQLALRKLTEARPDLVTSTP